MITPENYVQRRAESLKVLDDVIVRLMEFAEAETKDIASDFFEAINGLKQARAEAVRQVKKLLREMHSFREVDLETALAGIEQAWEVLRTAVLTAISATYGNTVGVALRD